MRYDPFMPYTHFSEDPDYNGPDRCAECGKQADRPYTCEACAHARCLEQADGDAAVALQLLDELFAEVA